MDLENLFEPLPDQGDNIIRMRDPPIEPNPNGLGYEYFWNMKRNKDALAQICAVTGTRTTYNDLFQKCVRVAIHLEAMGITPKDVVSVCTLNHINCSVPHIASFFIGAKVAALDPSLSYNDKKHLLTQVNPKLIFVMSGSEQEIANILHDLSMKTKIVVFGDTAENISFATFLQPTDGEDTFEPYIATSLQETAVIFFSSGTTGLPKGICATHYSILQQAINIGFMGVACDIFLQFSSMYWIGPVIILTQVVLQGTAMIFGPPFEAANTWEYIDKYKPTGMAIMPNQAIALLKMGKPENIDICSLKHIGVSGAPISEANLLSVKKMFCTATILQGYGQTETGGTITCFKPFSQKEIELANNKPTSCGRPSVGIWYKVVDLDTEKVVGQKQVGELRLKTKVLMNGYYNMDSSYVWDSDGWYRTGDVCYYDEDYCFYMVDRIKEMLKFQMWHVQPALMEGILYEHPAVKEAVVVGIPHEEDGDHPLGVVVLAENAGGVTPEELLTFVNERVADRQKLRGGIRILEKFPHNSNGKIRRRDIRQLILSEMNI